MKGQTAIKVKQFISQLLCFARGFVAPLVDPIKQFSVKIFSSLKAGLIKRVVSLALMLGVIVSVSLLGTTVTYAIDLNVDGHSIGRVQSRAVLEDALKSIGEQLVRTNIDCAPNITVEFAVGSPSGLNSSDSVCDALIAADNTYIYACGIFVDGNIVSYADDEQGAEQFLNDLLAKYDGNNTVVEFVGTVETKYGLYLESTVSKLPHLSEMADETDSYTYFTYILQSGDTMASVAKRFGVSAELLETVNLETDFSAGNTVNVIAKLPKICVRSTTVETKTSQSGYRVTEKSVKTIAVNGVEVSSEVLSSTSTLNLPKKRIKYVGSKGYCWPVDPDRENYVSSLMGDDRSHKGWDIAAKTGVAILAVKSGRVVGVNNAGSGYGLNVTIDHGNGITTLYAHCNAIYVSVGDKVEQGSVIATVGSTGRSTGPHLHFQIFRYGHNIDPSVYLR